MRKNIPVREDHVQVGTHLETLRNRKMTGKAEVQWVGGKWEIKVGEGRLEAGLVRASGSW